MAATITKGDIGTVLEATIVSETGAVVDVSGATLKQFVLRDPANAVTLKTASFSGTGTDGKIRYTTIAGDLALAGIYSIQGYVEISTSPKFHTSIVTFEVSANLN